MDYVTRQFINLSKKLRDDVRNLLSASHHDLEKISSSIESAAAQQHANDNQNRSPVIVRAELHEPETVINQREARETRKEQRDGRTEGRDRKRLLLETVGVGIAVILAFATVFQWRETRKATKIAAISAKAAQAGAEAAREQAQTAKESVEVTRRSIENTIETAHAEDRAWLGVEGFGIAVKAGQPSSAAMFFRNSGKTPAFDIVIEAKQIPSTFVIPDIEKWVATQKDFHWRSVSYGVLFPNQTTSFGGSDPNQPIITPSMEEEVRTGKITLYSMGQIFYTDIFHVRHRTSFCGLYSPTGNVIVLCPNFNDAN